MKILNKILSFFGVVIIVTNNEQARIIREGLEDSRDCLLSYEAELNFHYAEHDIDASDNEEIRQQVDDLNYLITKLSLSH